MIHEETGSNYMIHEEPGTDYMINKDQEQTL